MDRIYEAYYGTGGFGVEFMRRTRERLHWICSQCWGKSVLDVGCSQGICSILLGGMGLQAEGLDVNSEAIDFARLRLAEAPEEVRRNVTFRAAGFSDYAPPTGTAFDSIVMGEVLEHLVRPAAFVRKAFDLLKPDGRLVVTVPFGICDDPDHRQTFYLTEVYSMLFPLFEVEAVRFFDSWIGFVGRRRAGRTEDAVSIPTCLFTRAEEAFNSLERPLVDARKKVSVLTKQLSDERKKTSELQSQVAVVEAQFATLEAASTMPRVEVAEDEVHALRTSLEVERTTNRSQLEQIAFLKAALQLASQQKPDSERETRLLACAQEVRELRAALDAQRSEATESARRGLENLSGDLQRAQAEVTRLTKENEALVAEQSKAAEATERLVEIRERFENELAWSAQHKAEADRLKAEVERLKTELAGSAELSVQHREETEQVKAEADRLKAEVERLKTELAGSAEELSKKDRRLQDELAWSRQHRADEEETVKSLSVQAEVLAARNGDLEKRLFEMKTRLAEARRDGDRVSKDLAAKTSAYNKLAKAKLGRLTLAYWRWKDGR